MKLTHTPHNSKADVEVEKGMVAKVDQGWEGEEEAHILIQNSLHSEKGKAEEVGKKTQEQQLQIQMIAIHNEDNYYWMQF